MLFTILIILILLWALGFGFGVGGPLILTSMVTLTFISSMLFSKHGITQAVTTVAWFTTPVPNVTLAGSTTVPTAVVTLGPFTVQSHVRSNVFALSGKFEVFYSVVRLNPVNVMYDLGRFQLPAKVLLHNVSMFLHLFLINRKQDIAAVIKGFASLPVMVVFTGRRGFSPTGAGAIHKLLQSVQGQVFLNAAALTTQNRARKRAARVAAVLALCWKSGYVVISQGENLRHRFELWSGSSDCFRSPAGRFAL